MKLFNIFKAKPKQKLGDLMNNEVPRMIVKPGRATSTSTGMEFYEKYQKQSNTFEGVNEAKIEASFNETPMELNSVNKDRLRNGIIVSLEFKVDRKDLEFVGISRIDGKPIYLYTGYDFSHFNLPFEEVYASPEELVKPKQTGPILSDIRTYETISALETKSRSTLDRMKLIAGIRE